MAEERYKPRIYQTFFDLEKDPDRAKQAFKDQCDINRILDKAKKTGVLSHVNKYEQHYGDFADFDFEEAQIKLANAKSIFYDLEANVGAEFGNKPEAFFAYVNDPANAGDLANKLPALVEPGLQLPDVVGGRTETQPAELQTTETTTVSEPKDTPAE